MIRRAATALAVLGVAVAAQPAAAAPSVLRLSPSRAQTTLHRDLRLGPFTLANFTQESYGVEIIPVLLGQRRDGGMTLRDSPGSRRVAARYLETSVRGFSATPGAARSVFARVRSIPRRGSLHAAVLFRAKPRLGGPVPQMNRILEIGGTLLLEPPAHRRRVALQVAAPRAEWRDGGIDLVVPVRNAGNTFVRVGGAARVRDARGRLVSGGRVRPLKILPRVVVDVRIRLSGTLRAGRHTAGVTFTSGRGLFRTVGPIFMGRDGRPPTRTAVLEPLVPPDAVRGEPLDVEAGFRPTGNVKMRPHAVAEWRAAPNGPVLHRAELRAGRAARPPATGGLSGSLPAVRETGELTVRLLDGDRELDRAVVAVVPRESRSLGDWLADVSRRHAPALGVLLALALVSCAGLTAVAARQSRWSRK